jgi:beta-ureidopropionase / N-carbamoyl-L-amino-acid hydrolase
MGSHLDSVATGGRFDGPLGVIGALEIVRSLKEQGIETYAPLALINWTNEEGARFFPPLGSSVVYAGQSTVASAHESKANNGSDEALGAALQAIGYVGDGPNTFEDSPLSAHFEIHVEQQKTLEKAGKSVGWFEGWHGISVFEVTFGGDDGHANTYDMAGRRDALVGASELITAIEKLAVDGGDPEARTTVTAIRSGPVGCCNIQSWTKVVFCIMHPSLSTLTSMAQNAEQTAKSIAAARKLDLSFNRIMHLEPGGFWPEATECIKRACGDKGMGTQTLTAHDSTMTTLVCPTAMVVARAKDGISHCAREWTTQEDCAEGIEVLGKAVLNFDEMLRHRGNT